MYSHFLSLLLFFSYFCTDLFLFYLFPFAFLFYFFPVSFVRAHPTCLFGRKMSLLFIYFPSLNDVLSQMIFFKKRSPPISCLSQLLSPLCYSYTAAAIMSLFMSHLTFVLFYFCIRALAFPGRGSELGLNLLLARSSLPCEFMSSVILASCEGRILNGERLRWIWPVKWRIMINTGPGWLCEAWRVSNRQD